MIEKEAFIAALLPICDTVCEYDRTRESCGSGKPTWPVGWRINGTP